MRCDGCKHWNVDHNNQEWEARIAGFGECLAVRERWRIADEAVPREVKFEDGYENLVGNALKAARAYVQDGSEYRAELFTGPDFFCALFASR